MTNYINKIKLQAISGNLEEDINIDEIEFTNLNNLNKNNRSNLISVSTNLNTSLIKYNNIIFPHIYGFYNNNYTTTLPSVIKKNLNEFETVIAFNYFDNFITYDFFQFENSIEWLEYADSIGATYSLTNIQDWNGSLGVFTSGTAVGWIQFPAVPSGYNEAEITFGNIHTDLVRLVINETTIHELSGVSEYVWTGLVNEGDIIKIEEVYSVIDANLKIIFKNNQSLYSITFPQNTECDILIVGGGGSGGVRDAGAGGAGGLIYLPNKNILNANINIGNGGKSITSTLSSSGNNGYDTILEIINEYNDKYVYTAYGGGKGGGKIYNGLIFNIYNGYFSDNVNWFKTQTPINTGISYNGTNVGTFTNNIKTENSSDNYSIEWFGYFRPNQSGSHTFYTNSDDASYLWIGTYAMSGYTSSNALVNNGNLHGMNIVSGSIDLVADTLYPIRIQYGENTSGDNIIVYFTTPNGTTIYNGLNYYYNNLDDLSGGSGGGGGGGGIPGGISKQLLSNGYGNNGSKGSSSYSGGGGGGAGGIGNINSDDTGGDGGIGKDFSHIFGNEFGDNGWFAGGGGAGSGSEIHGKGGLGGGGNGAKNGIAESGINGSGGGGGSNRNINGTSGSGGSGIILIKYNNKQIYFNNNDKETITNLNKLVDGQGENTTKYYEFTNSNIDNYTNHTFILDENKNCELLVVGGGGGGGQYGGGGGGGDVIYYNDIELLAGTYNIKVGNGGKGGNSTYKPGSNGYESRLELNENFNIIAGGGNGGNSNSEISNILTEYSYNINNNIYYSSGGGGGGGATSTNVNNSHLGNLSSSGNGGNGINNFGGGGGGGGNQLLEYNVIILKNKGDVQSKYTINFNNNTLCDIIIIGGGGGGGGSAIDSRGAGGGGAGEYLYKKNILLYGTYTIYVGKGGKGGTGNEVDNTSLTDENNGDNGYSSYINKNNILYEALGGGGGAGGTKGAINNAYNGACGGGRVSQGGGGTGSIGYNGGAGSSTDYWVGGGGGGMSSVGEDGNSISGGNGGLGVLMDIDIGITTNVCGGGGGGGYSVLNIKGGIGNDGGGGGGGYSYISNGISYNGLDANSYGGGGGGATIGNDTSSIQSGGNGGSGIVIIKYRNLSIYDYTISYYMSYNIPPTISNYINIDDVTNNLIAHYTFDDTNNIGYDKTGNYNLDNNGSIQASITESLDGTYYADLVGNGKWFTNNSLNLSNKTFSISLWNMALYNKGLMVDGEVIIGQGSTPITNQSLHIGLRNNNSLGIKYMLAFYANDLDHTTYYQDWNIWTHLVFIVEKISDTICNRYIYRNGELIISDTNKSNLTASGTFYLGRTGYSTTSYTGYIDDLRIYNYVLTQNEITNIFKKNNIQTVTDINNEYEYIIFKNKGDNQSEYSIIFSETSICDILVVGGGGAGGGAGGAGGGGDVMEYKNLNLYGEYNIFVGRGGLKKNEDGCLGGESGFNSKIMKNGNDYIIAAGGGGGGNYGYYTCNGANGTNARVTPTTTFQDPITNQIITTSGGGGGVIWSNRSTGSGNGVSGNGGYTTDSNQWRGGAGGGAVGNGGNTYGYHTYEGSQYFGNGGEGYKSDITGELIGYGGGGSAGQWNPPLEWSSEKKNSFSPSIDGGGSFNDPGIQGRGGGGSMSANGGSGIIIIKYKKGINLKINYIKNAIINNLVAHYKFDDNFTDSTGNHEDIINYSSSFTSTYVVENQAIEFENTNYLELPSSINPYNIWNGNGITFSIWFRITSKTGNWIRILDISPTTSSNGVLILLYYNTNTLSVQLAETRFLTNLTTSVDSQYHHLVWSVDTIGNWSVWIDGINQNCSIQLSIPNHQINNIRYINKSAYSNDGSFTGQIDEFRIYDKVLLEENIHNLYGDGFISNKLINIKNNNGSNGIEENGAYGGLGVLTSINGIDNEYGGGGGGGVSYLSKFINSNYGRYGGGNGGIENIKNAMNGINGTGGGGGGGGGGEEKNGGDGGSGIVIIKTKAKRIVIDKNNNIKNKYIEFNLTGSTTSIIDGISSLKWYWNTKKLLQNISNEKLYPSLKSRENSFKKIDGISPELYEIYGYEYGNGKYTIKYSSENISNLNSPHYVFAKGLSDPENNAMWDINYNNGIYEGVENFANDNYYGDWLSIELPVSIVITKIIFTSSEYSLNNLNKLPRKYRIYGSNNGSEWDIIINENINDNEITETYNNINNIAYKKIINGSRDYNHYALVVNKIGNSNTLAIADFEIYGYEISKENIYYYKYNNLNDNGNSQSEYYLNITNNSICDILLIGGGGGGGTSIGSGGGAGGLVLLEDIKLNIGNYLIKVGKGGNGASNTNERGENGYDSSIDKYVAFGGGGGNGQTYIYNESGTQTGKGGFDGGSGGGGSRYKTEPGFGIKGQGNNGGNGEGISPGGGGGAGEKGGDSVDGAKGGNGLYQKNNINFKNHFNIKDLSIGHHINNDVWFCGGGIGDMQLNKEGSYGGGGGNINKNGLLNSGGGGAGIHSSSGGNGGSGIVIVKIKNNYELLNNNTEITYYYEQKRVSENVYIINNLNTNINLNTENIVFDNGVNDIGTEQEMEALILDPGNYRVSFFEGYIPDNVEGQNTLYACSYKKNYFNQNIVDNYVYETNIGNKYKCIQFLNDGNNQTSYNITFHEDTICDILVVGGGGAGGNSMGGGGGAGGVVYTINQTLNAGTYQIGVGKGGLGLIITDPTGQGTIGTDQDGIDSFIKDSNGNYISLNMGGVNQDLRAYGGGGGGVYYDPTYVNGRNGGSGGGSSETNNNNWVVNTGGSALQGNTLWNGTSYVAGGKDGRQNTTTSQDYQGGGGGGVGNESSDYTNGNDGIQIAITGTNVYYAAGGGAGQFSNVSLSKGLGGSSIGGNGRVWNGSSYLREATSGTQNTGSGGGGGAFNSDPDNAAGSGGSGIVILRFSILNSYDINAKYTKNYNSIPLVRSLGVVRGWQSYHHQGSINIPNIPEYNFTLLEKTAVVIHTTATTGWNNTYGNYNNYTNQKEVILYNTYFKSQYNNLDFPYSNNYYWGFNAWQGESWNKIKIIKLTKKNIYDTINNLINKTQVSDWRLVRYLPYNWPTWHQSSDNLLGTDIYGNSNDFTNPWSVNFGTFDEFCFSTFDLSYWLYCTKDSVYGDNIDRNIIKSSLYNYEHTKIWRNESSNPEDPLITLENFGSSNPAYAIYAENSISSINYGELISENNGGLCVWVRNSTTSSSTWKTIIYDNYSNIEQDGIIKLDYNNLIYKIINNNISSYNNLNYNLFSEERLYPPYFVRKKIITSNITISNKIYGNGKYNISWSSNYDNTISNSPLNVFIPDNESAKWNINSYTNNNILLTQIPSRGIYNGNNYIVSDYKGEWIKIVLPYKILLTRFIISYYNSSINGDINNEAVYYFPLDFRIYGSNDTTNWNLVISKNITRLDINSKYNNINNNLSAFDYKIVNNERLTNYEMYSAYALVVNKTGGETYLNISSWDIYGKEKGEILLIRPDTIPINQNIKFTQLVQVYNKNIIFNNNINYENIKFSDYYLSGSYIKNNILNQFIPKNGKISISDLKGTSSIDISIPYENDRIAHYTSDINTLVFNETNIIQWNDISNNNNNITIYTGTPNIQNIEKNTNGLIGNDSISVIEGDENSGFEMPFSLNNNNYTFCYMARYTNNLDTTYNKRIFTAKNENTLWGFWNNITGISHNNEIGFYTYTHKHISNNNDWLIGIETTNSARFNGMNCDNNYTINTTNYPKTVTSTNNPILTINLDPNEKSKWQITEIIFYNRELTDNEKKEVEQYLAIKYGHISFKNVIPSLNDFKNLLQTGIYDMWYFIYDGFKYGSDSNSNIYGPFGKEFKLFKSNNNYYSYAYFYNNNSDNISGYNNRNLGSRIFHNIYLSPNNTNYNINMVVLGAGGGGGKNYGGGGSAGGQAYIINQNNITDNILKITNGVIGIGGSLFNNTIENTSGGDAIIEFNNSKLIGFGGYEGYDNIKTSINGGRYEAYLERMYPPTRNLTSASHTISEESYGNGVYKTWESTVYNTNYIGYSAFNLSIEYGYHGAISQYDTSNGIYIGTNYIVSDYKGDWIKIQLPVKIKLTKYGFKQRNNFSTRAPGKYKIYGSNDGINWEVLVHKTTTISYTQTITTTNDYFEESVSITNFYDYYAIVCNQLLGLDHCINLDEWYIYGTEEINAGGDIGGASQESGCGGACGGAISTILQNINLSNGDTFWNVLQDTSIKWNSYNSGRWLENDPGAGGQGSRGPYINDELSRNGGNGGSSAAVIILQF